MDDKMFDQIKKHLKDTRVKAPAHLTAHIMRAIEEAPLKQNAAQKRLPLWNYAFRPVPVVAYAVLVLMVFSLFMVNRSNTVTVTFTLYKPEAKSVAIVGDFNRWNRSANALVSRDSHWTTTLKLKPGEYQYSFVIDGQEWMPDPANNQYVESDFGGVNSVVEIAKM